MRHHQLQIRQWIAGRTAKLMFTLSLIFLFGQAILVVVWADVPMLIENALKDVDPDSLQAQRLQNSLASPLIQRDFASLTLLAMKLIWPVFIIEAIFHWCTRPWTKGQLRFHFFGLLFCICPSLRMCARCPELGERIWLPTLGWRRANKHLRARLEKYFSLPMIMIALLIMPVLIIEFFMKNQVAQYAWLRWGVHIGTGVIWFAFAAEFILMLSVAEKKIDYCKKHWIDLAIILLPFISFLRSLRILRASRAAKLVRVSQISKFARVYGLRGTAVKALRALILLELFQRLAGGPEASIRRLQKRLDEIEDEAKELRYKIARMRRELPQPDQSKPGDSLSDNPKPDAFDSKAVDPDGAPPHASSEESDDQADDGIGGPDRIATPISSG